MAQEIESAVNCNDAFLATKTMLETLTSDDWRYDDFCHEMNIDESTGLSYDPALLSVFQQLWGSQPTRLRPEAFCVAIAFVAAELVILRNVVAADVVRSLREAQQMVMDSALGRAWLEAIDR